MRTHHWTRTVARAGRLSLLTPFAGILLSTVPLFGQTGAVRGTIRVSDTAVPVGGAQVRVQGTNQGAVTDARGVFTIRALSPGRYELVTRILGYQPQTRIVTVAAGDTARVDFQLVTAALSLDAVVVTGTAGAVQERTIGNVVQSIQIPDKLELREPLNVQRLISAEVPGERIRLSSGELGTGGQIKIRGISTLALSGNPLVVVDGIRIDNNPNASSAAFHAQCSASRMNDIDPDEIEKMEVIKGPAAGTLYGTEAASGVIQIITKKGQPGPARFNVTIGSGANFYRNPAGLYPLVWGIDPVTKQLVSTNLVASEAARGTPI